MFHFSSLYYLLIITIHIHGSCVHVNNPSIIEGYYWRDYNGDIPKDAVPGGKDSAGRTTYIGQILRVNAGILSGMISQVDKKMYYELHKVEYSTTQDVKILCSQHPEKLKWIVVKVRDPVSIVGDKELVLGGSFNGQPLLIGRLALPDGQVALGHALVVSELIDLLAYTLDGKGIVNGGGPYEVLVYDPTFNKYQDANECDRKIVNINIY